MNQAKAPPLHRRLSQLQLAVRRTSPARQRCGWSRAIGGKARALRCACGSVARRRAVWPQEYEARNTAGAADTLGSRVAALLDGYHVVPVGRSVYVPPPKMPSSSSQKRRRVTASTLVDE